MDHGRHGCTACRAEAVGEGGTTDFTDLTHKPRIARMTRIPTPF
jgi:hypothetical protein